MATRLEMPFIDLDEVIVERMGASIREVFVRHGEEVFRREETWTLRRAAEGADAVVATGGGCFCDPGNREIITAGGGRSVFLQVPWSIIRQRLPGDNAERPKLGDEESAQALYRHRKPWYRMASVTVAVAAGEAPEQVAGNALEALSLKALSLEEGAEVECAT